MQEPALVGEAAEIKADITNFAETVAVAFRVEFLVVRPGQEEQVLDIQDVEAGLGAGAAITLTTSITPDVAGGLRLIARVDPSDQITETDETDNEKVLEIIAVENEVNLTLAADGLTVLCNFDPATPRTCLFTIKVTNTGQTTVVGPMSVKYFGYSAAGDYYEWGTVDFDIDLAPGAELNQQVAFTVDAGTYRAYALADSGENWPETNEDDNEAFVDFTSL